jgi:hypothetical protein
MEASIQGLLGREGAIRETVQKFFNRAGVQVPNCAPENFVQAIMTAVKTANKKS